METLKLIKYRVISILVWLAILIPVLGLIAYMIYHAYNNKGQPSNKAINDTKKRIIDLHEKVNKFIHNNKPAVIYND